ncbi:MAG: hypothetical protein GXO62_07655 [Epsilonproteobacteria bacterium]|nr:hypothetical protein [Campylobacterota bacterium]
MNYKELVEVLLSNNIICKELSEVELNTRQKVKAYLGVNLKKEYCYIVWWGKKSKFLKKDIDNLNSFVNSDINFRYKKKILLLNAPICSKAKEELKNWKIISL